jgi:hypothetical protein
MALAGFGTAPAVNTAGSLRWIGNDRQIAQGFQESTDSYRARLLQWLIRHSYRGKAAGLLMSVRGWILPQMPLLYSIKDSPGNNPWLPGPGTLTTWSHYSDGQDPMPAGAVTVDPPLLDLVSPRNFDWDGNYPPPYVDSAGVLHLLHRAFLVIFSTSTVWVGPENVWGSSDNWGDQAGCWGFNQPQSVLSGIKQLVRVWKSAGTWYSWIIVSFDGALFDPTQPADGTHNPNGTFGAWSKIVAGVYVQSRFQGARYMNGWGWPGGT